MTHAPDDQIRELEDLLDGQLDEEIVEIDSDGNVTSLSRRPETLHKPTILHDPHGEYGNAEDGES